jgi:exopolyphosphatase / guanosine-5'-triphosphate,3'-diphosphate pyrophosphatase
MRDSSAVDFSERGQRPASAATEKVAGDSGGVRPRQSAPNGFPRRSGAPGSAGELYAALDLGTNNCRLLVARPSREGFRVIDAYSRIVRLGEGLALTNRLSESAVERAIDALRVCRAKLDARGVTRARLVATEACRAAENGAAFIARVAVETGLELEIIDRKTEAYLAATGCAALADPAANSIVLFDIGGGSTEIVWLTDRPKARAGERMVRAWVSLPVGVVTLADRYGGIIVTSDNFGAMQAEVSTLLAPFAKEARAAVDSPRFHLLGTSGTVTTVAGLHLGLERYDRRQVDGIWMASADVKTVVDNLLAMSFTERAANGCIGSDRADLVLAGCAILEAIRAAFPSNRIRIADRGLREGILMELMQADGVWFERRERR